jgi:hypothetical protein
MYDSRLGTWLSIDPHESRYPGISPYNFSFANPIIFNDQDGRDGRLTIDYENRTITLQSTIHIYGANSGAEGQTFAANSNASFDALTNTYKIKDKDNPSVEWTVKIDVVYVYNDCIDSYNEAMGIDPVAPLNGREGETYAGAGIGLEDGDNVYNMSGAPGGRDLGHSTQGGNEAKGEATFSTMMHEVFHELGYDERYMNPYGVPIVYYESDFLTSGYEGKEIHPIHLVDLTDYTTQNYCESGCYVVGNQPPTYIEQVIQNPPGSPYEQTIKSIPIGGKSYKVDDTGSGAKFDIKGDEIKVKARASF